MDASNPGMARCPRCRAYDAWDGGPVRVESMGLVMLEHRCGVCRRTWRVPVTPRPVSVIETSGPCCSGVDLAGTTVLCEHQLRAATLGAAVYWGEALDDGEQT